MNENCCSSETNNFTSNILLTPINSLAPIITRATNATPALTNYTNLISQTPSKTSSNLNLCQTPSNHSNTSKQANTLTANKTNKYPLNKDIYKSVNFADAHLVIKRDNQGKHIVGKILLSTQQTEETTSTSLNKSPSSNNLNLASTSDNSNKFYGSVAQNQQQNKLDICNCEEMNAFKNTSFLSSLKHNTSNNMTNTSISNSNKNSNSMQENNNNLSKNKMTNPFSTPQPQSPNSKPIINSPSSMCKAESLLKNKVKKLINRIPTHNNSNNNNNTGNNSNNNTISNSTLPPNSARKSLINTLNNTNLLSNQNSINSLTSNSSNGSSNKPTQANSPMPLNKVTTGLLKFNRTHNGNNSNENSSSITDTLGSNATTTGYNSLNDDSSSDFLENTPVYTETKLPPRILRKYQKQRAITEAIISNPEKQKELGSETGSGSGSGLDSSSGLGSPTYFEKTADLKNDPIDYEKYFQPSSADIECSSKILPVKEEESVEPKAPPRIKKKYRKSKTTDLSRYQQPNNPGFNSNLSMLKDEDADSLESDGDETRPNTRTTPNDSLSPTSLKPENTEKPIQRPKPPLMEVDSLDQPCHGHFSTRINSLDDRDRLTGSIDSLNVANFKSSTKLKLQQSGKIEEDSLALNDSLASSNNSLNKLEARNELDNSLSKTRPLWDKTRQEIDLMYFKFSNLKQEENSKKQAPPTRPAMPHSHTTGSIAQRSSPTKTPMSKLAENNNPTSKQQQQVATSTVATKRARNLNLAKEKLYEMKKTIDAKVNLDNVNMRSSQTCLNQAPVTPQPKPKTNIAVSSRTTPRKVKKRSGERSLTTGILLENETEILSKSKENLATNPTKPRAAAMPKFNTNFQNVRKTSASLHNLASCAEDNNVTGRTRRDSYGSTVSSGTNYLYSTTPNEYKENKAYELRKKSTLMNKIIVKNQQVDPIYSRSHPCATEIAEQQCINAAFVLTSNTSHVSIGSYEQSAANRKRLFTKKNERVSNFDPNLSLGSNGSTGSSSSQTNHSAKIPTSFSMNFATLQQPKPKTARPCNKLVNESGSRRPAQTGTRIPPRSKSNNDLYYALERTNSTQDLIELINNCEPPVGDLSKYKIMLSECERFEPAKTKPKQKQTKKSATLCNSKAVLSPRSQQQVYNNKINVIQNEDELNGLNDSLEKLDFEAEEQRQRAVSATSDGKHKRSRSLPPYANIPDISIVDYDVEVDVSKFK